MHDTEVEHMKPILFNTSMVKAILEGRKKVTRRVIRPQPSANGKLSKSELGYPRIVDNTTGMMWTLNKSPYEVGDILYVRETWLKTADGYYYKADAKIPSESEDLQKAYDYKWRPSIHMPKEAARIFLKVTDIRIERLQDIDGYEVEKEGLNFVHNLLIYKDKQTFNSLAHKEFSKLWDSTIKKQDLDKYGWKSNPWVWVIEFERVEKPT